MNPMAKHQSWADVAVFEDLNTGKTIETFLRSKGLEARTYDDKFFRWFLFLRPPLITYHVQVRQDNVKVASHILADNAPAELQKALHCPSCNSLQVSYPQMTRKFMFPTIALHLGIIFRLVDHECYCEHCHWIWHLGGEKIPALAKPARQFLNTWFP